jgi:hypothetical protein
LAAADLTYGLPSLFREVPIAYANSGSIAAARSNPARFNSAVMQNVVLRRAVTSRSPLGLGVDPIP